MEYGDLIIIYPKLYSIYLRGTIDFGVQGLLERFLDVSLMEAIFHHLESPKLSSRGVRHSR